MVAAFPDPAAGHSKVGSPWWIVVGPGFAVCVGSAVLSSIYRIGGTSAVQRELGLSGPVFLIVAVVAYLLAVAAAFPLGYRFGRRYWIAVTLPALAVMLVGTLLVAFAAGAATLLVARVFEGLATGAVAGVCVALASRMASGRAVAVGLAVCAGLSMVLGSIVGQAISDALSFRAAQLVPVPFLVVAAFLTAVTALVLHLANRQTRQVPPYPRSGPPR